MIYNSQDNFEEDHNLRVYIITLKVQEELTIQSERGPDGGYLLRTFGW